MTSVKPSDDKKEKWREKIKNTYNDGSKYLVYELSGLALDHHNMRVVCQGWLNPYTSAAQMGFQGPDEWRPFARQLWSGEHWLKKEERQH